MIDFRTYFPIYKSHPRLCYLDSGATAQKLSVALESEQNYYTRFTSNVHRGMYSLSEQASAAYENARVQVASFVNAEADEIVFTHGATDSFNQVVAMLKQLPHLANPHILLGVAEHHSNILPWQTWEEAKLEFVDLDHNYQYELDRVVHQPDIISLTLMSNVTGAILDVVKLRELFPDSLLILDAAQAAPHMPIDVKALGADIVIMSGHKLYAGTGVGVTWAKRDLWKQLSPAQLGGGIVREVYRSYVSFKEAPHKFEAGTPPIAQAVGLGAAVNFLQNKIGWEAIEAHEKNLIDSIKAWLPHQKGVELYRAKGKDAKAGGIFSFSVSGIHAHDVAFGLGQNEVAVRAGHHCTQILHREVLKVPATTRISIGLNNTEEDFEKLVQVMPQVLGSLRA